MKLRKALLSILGIVIFSICISTTSKAASKTIAFDIPVTEDYKSAYEVLDIVNKERASQGKAKLTMDKDLLATAMLRANELVLNFSHTRPDGTSCFSAITKNTGGVGENIAAGYYSPEDVMTGWMNSSGHRANILMDDFTTIGIGSVKYGAARYWVQVFGSSNLAKATPTTANKNVTRKINMLSQDVELYFNTTSSFDKKYYAKTGFQTVIVVKNPGWPIACATIQPKDLTYSVSDKSIFSIDSKGVLKPVSAGTATLTVKLKQDPTKVLKQKIDIIGYLSDTKVADIARQAYTGKNVKPKLTIKDGNKTLKDGRDYTLTYTNNKKVGTATVTIKGKGAYVGTLTKKFYIVPKKVAGLKAKTQATTSVTLSWSKSTGASGYEVYKYNSSKKKWQKVTSTSKNTYKVSKLKAGTTYQFKVRAYKSVSGKKYYSPYSTTLKWSTKPVKTSITSISSKSKKATVKWKKVSGATGYEIYMATSKNGKYTRVKNVTSSKTIKYTKSSLKKNKKYYFKVRAYKTVNGQKIKGAFSSVKTIKVK